MTGWTIDGRGDCGTQATHWNRKGKHVYNVQRMASGFYIADVTYPDGSKHIINASERMACAAQARCEYHAANLPSDGGA